jgi:hypothetical protein
MGIVIVLIYEIQSHKLFIMRKLNLLLIAMVVMSMSSCAVIGGIFKAGAIVGILAVVIVIAIIIWIISLFRGKS